MWNYTVELKPEAEDDLAEIWTKAHDRAAVTAAEAEIHRRLGSDPVRHGVPVSEGLYKVRVPPLTAYFTIDAARRHVDVTNIKRPQP